jgi:type II secretory pathway pseudopilin PulG
MFSFSNARVSARRRYAGFTVWELLAVVAVVIVIFALIIPAMTPARSRSYKNTCRNSMRQIGLAIVTYEEANRTFPALYSRNMSAEEAHEKRVTNSFNADPTLVDEQYTWMVRILPYIEEKNLYNQIMSASENWNANPSGIKVVNAENKQIAAANYDMPAFRCASFAGNAAPGTTNYVALTATKQQFLTVGKDTATLADGVVIPGDERKSYRGAPLGSIRDGVSKTVMLTESTEAERSNWFHWQQTFVCGFLPGDTSVVNNDPLTGVPRVEQDQTWIFNKSAGDRTALNFGPRTSSANQQLYNAMPNDPLRRKFGPSSDHIGDVVVHVNADNSIREIVSTGIDPKVYYSGITRAGNEKHDFED